jgi:hypothetical protein
MELLIDKNINSHVEPPCYSVLKKISAVTWAGIADDLLLFLKPKS